MAEIKSHEFDRFVERGNQHYRIFLVYGPDRGLVSERAAVLAGKSGVAQDDPFAMLKLDMEDIKGNPGRILDEVNSIGLFGGSKLVWIRDAGNDKALADAVQALADLPPSDNMLILEAGDLKKGSALRKVGETARAIATIPCYADDTRSLNALIDHELQQEGLRISTSARQRLLELLGGDRIASRNEIRKLALYCRGEGTIEESHVNEIIGDASGVSPDEVVDAVLAGDLAELQRAFQKVVASKTPIFLILQSCLKQFQLMDLMRAEMDENKASTAQVMLTLGRHIHFKRKPLIEQALRIWSANALSREAQRLQQAILITRQRQTLEPEIALQMLMAVVVNARR